MEAILINMTDVVRIAEKHSTMRYLSLEVGMSCNTLRYRLMKIRKLDEVKKILQSNSRLMAGAPVK